MTTARPTSRLFLILGFVASSWPVTILAGCASSPPEHFYTLSSSLREAARTPPDAPPGPSVVVAVAAVPDLVDRPQLVTLADTNRVVILEQQRWAEPLRTAIPRVVAEGLGRQLGEARVSTRDEALADPDCRVQLDVRRFDARPGIAVDLETLWSVACAGGVKHTGRSVAHQPVLGPGTDAVVAAQGRALETLTVDLAHALRARAPIATAGERR